ncbi:MAG: DEAD/DEAH box helicase [Alphaproteobacteria bacterium]|jgi:superfamily II DNA/RNA helicase|nr:DEAD/DEAH box helicase [Alphaproteobacteria bacterium]MBO6863298.1 DEAD/DEAH box helicase [Alphaproteobacteria bacterium]
MATTFADLGLSDPILRAISDAGYETPTPIQEKAIPYVLMNRDILGCAQTGTGKTASFTLPMIDILSQGRGRARMPRTVILEPTRELAAQVADNFETYGKYNKLNMALLIGGVSFSEQEAKINRGVDVLIATPGRLLDHCERGKVILTDVKVLVIDEGDRMLDMGFIPDVEKLVSLMPPLRQTLMFSATMPPEIRKLASKFLSNPKEITVAPPASTADTIEQRLMKVDGRQKRRTLDRLLKDDTIKNALVFCNRKRDVASLYRALEQSGFSAGALHGDMDQYKRLEWLDKFKKNEINILVCSDVAARGLDIPSVSHVFNYDVPTHSEDYVHRIGRTGRAGRSGVSITFASDNDRKYLDAIEKLIGKKIPLVESGTASASDDADDTVETTEETRAEEPKTEARQSRGSRSRGKSAPKKEEPREGRSRRGGRERSPAAEANDDPLPDISDVPYGKTEQVPAFLLRAR